MESYTVIAWVHKNGNIEKTDEWERFDGVNWRPKFRTIPQPCAVVWLKSAAESALESAQRHAQTIEADFVRVYQYAKEQNPLGRARREVLEDMGRV
jgi:hypothetical protein